MVMRFGAIHEGTLPTSHSQYPCIKGSRRDRPALWYLCSSSRFNWCLDSGGVGNWNNLFNTHPVVLICPKPTGDSGWESPHRFLVDRCPLMELGFLLLGDNYLSCLVAFCGYLPGGPNPTSTSLEIATPTPGDWVTDRRQHVHDTFTIAVMRGDSEKVEARLRATRERAPGLRPGSYSGPVLHFEAGAGWSGTGKKVVEDTIRNWNLYEVFHNWFKVHTHSLHALRN